MADIFENPDMIVTPSVNGRTTSGKEYTGDKQIDAYLNSLPADERDEAYSVITAPKTGEDIHHELAEKDQAYEEARKKGQNITPEDPTEAEWIKLNDYYRKKDSDHLAALSGAAGHIFETLIHKPFASIGDDPSAENISKIPASVLEGASQLVRGYYGIAAESADSTSPQAKFFNLLNGRKEDSTESYKVFLEARKFLRDSNDLAAGRTTQIFDKNHLNNDFVQAAALVADPLMFVPFGKAFGLSASMLGMAERGMTLGARTSALKSMVLGGAIKYVAGMPIEFVGKATRATLDYGIATGERAFVAATGVSSDTFRTGMKMSGIGSLGSGYFGHSIPMLTSASGAYVAGTAAAGVGEALSIIGNQIQKGERGIASYAKQAMIDAAKEGVQLSGHSKALLKIIDGFDPLVGYVSNVAGGAAHGAQFGAALGWWSGGSEGAASGAGAGIMLGGIGATGGKLLADVTGRTTAHRTAIQAKLVIEGLRDIHPEQAQMWDKAQAWAKSRGFNFDAILASKDVIHPNTHLEIFSEKQYADFLHENNLDPETYDGKKFLKDGDQPLSLKSFEQQNGYVIENKANGMVKIYINADAAPRATLGHELFHSILRTSAMKDYYSQAVKEKVIGTRGSDGAILDKGVVDPKEVKQMFRRYIDAEFKDVGEKADALSRLELAEKEYEESGAMVSDPSLGGRPLLEHLSEEFGAYYFSHLVMDKPVDWLYHGGDLPGIRGVLENASLQFRNYWRSRMGMTAPEFDFGRTFIDENGDEKLVPIDEVFAPAKRDMFGNITGKTKRVVNPAMDMFFRDMLRIEKTVNETGQFDISHLNKENQVRFIEGEGLDGVFSRDISGNYKHNTEAQIKRENRIKGKAVYKLLMGIPEAERTFFIDGEGNIRGNLSPEILDNIVNSGHMTRAMANKISLFQSITSGKAGGNIVDFGGVGATAERVGDVNNPSRMYGSRVPFKSRTGVVYGLDVSISKNGDFQFKGNMLDYKVIEIRANNTWSDPHIQSLWNGNHTEFMADFYRYLENASKAHDHPDRKPSAELWTDDKGSERRNAMHQVLGLAKGEADTFINSPNAEINRNTLSSVFSFSLNRMTNLRVRNQSVPFVFENAYRDLVRNWSPREMDSEITPNGTIFKHPSGFKLIQRQNGKTDAYDEQGKRIGTFEDANKAAEGAKKYAVKNPSTVTLKDNMTDNSVINRSPREGEGEVPLISRSETAEARRIGDLFNTDEMQKFVGDRKLVKQTADEGYTDFIKKFREGDINQETALMMLDQMHKDMFGGLDRQTNRLRLKELQEKAKVNFEKENPKNKDLYKELPERKLKEHLSLSEYIEAKRLEEALDKPASQKQLHSEFTASTATDFAKKIEEAKKWVKKANHQYNDFAGYLADNVPMREYYQHAVYSKQFRTGEPVVAVGVHGTSTSEGFLKTGKYSTSDKSLEAGEVAGAYFAASDNTALSGEYQGYDRGSNPPNIAKSAIRFDNPLVVDGQQTPMMKRTEKILGEAIEKGHDGVIYINQTDGGGLDVSFIVPANKVNKHQRMIGSTRDKAKAGASYEPLPRGEGVTNRTVNLSPNEGEGELGTSRYAVPREEPIYNDSIGYHEKFAIDTSRELPFDATHFESLVTYVAKTGDTAGHHDFSNAPNPQYHNLWQYLDYHQQAKSAVTVGDVLNFIKEQGKHRAPNMPVDIHSKFAQMLLSLSDNNQLNTKVELLNTGSWTGGETIVTMTRQYEARTQREATLRERFELLRNQYARAPTPELKKEISKLKQVIETAAKETQQQKEKIKQATEERQKRDEDEADDGTKKEDKYRFPITRVVERKSHQQLFLNLAELIDKTWAASDFASNLGNSSGSERARRVQALNGQSFEGTALEELAHSIFGRISREAGDAAPELKGLIETDSPTSMEGDAWKYNVEKFLTKTKEQIKNGIILPPEVVAFARVLELQKYACENTYILNPKGTVETLWESKGYKLNAQVYTDAGKLKSSRGQLKKGYRVVNPWEIKGFKGDREHELPRSWKERSVYRLGSTQEFLITLFNDPAHLARWNHMPVKPSLLTSLDTPDVNVGFKKNVASLHNQMAEALSTFIGYEGTFSHQVLEEMIRVIDSGRDASKDISEIDVGNTRGKKKSELPNRPEGFLSPYEKAFVNDWRTNMTKWAEANGKPNALEGLSDFEIWKRVGEDQPPFEGSDEAMRDPAGWRINQKTIEESEAMGISLTAVRENVNKYKKFYDSQKENRKTIRVGTRDPDTGKWNMIGDPEKTTTTVDPVIEPDKTTTTVDTDGNTTTTTVDTDGNTTTTIVDTDGNTTTTTIDTDGTPIPTPKRVPVPTPKKTPTPTPTTTVPPKPMPARDFTHADIRAWRSFKTETYGNGSVLTNILNYAIVSLNGTYRVYDPQKHLLGVYKDEEDAKKRIRRMEPKR